MPHRLTFECDGAGGAARAADDVRWRVAAEDRPLVGPLAADLQEDAAVRRGVDAPRPVGVIWPWGGGGTSDRGKPKETSVTIVQMSDTIGADQVLRDNFSRFML